jgi:hypothetical protein
MKGHYSHVVSLSEKMIPGILNEQDLNRSSRDYGGRVPVDRGFSEPGASAGAVAHLAGLICCPASRWYRSEELTSRALLFCRHLLTAQHPDGTIDLRETNFHDATMVGFSIQKLGYTYRLLLESDEVSSDLEELRDKIHTFLVRGAEGMLAGGFHTPNHRWVMTSALSLAGTILEDPRLVAEAERYLREGIDCTEAGEYTERSAGIYNVVNNRSLIIAAEELQRPELLDHVRRNLDMMVNYFEPDGSIFTLNSRRQDFGRTVFPVNYYENYLLMAHRDSSSSYAGIADAILALASDSRTTVGEIGPVLTHYLIDPALREIDLPGAPLQTSYRFENLDSGIVRARTDDVSVSLLSGHSVFLRFQVGGLAVSTRFAGTFYGERGRFAPTELRSTAEGYRLESHSRWGYYRPLADPPNTTDWEAMPHMDRDHAMVSDFDVLVDVRILADSAELTITASGTDNVLTKLELLVTAGGWLDTGSLLIPGNAGGTAVLKSGSATYRLGADAVTIEGGFAEHNSTSTMRGSEAQVPEAFTIYCAGYTPLEKTITLRRNDRKSHTHD